MTFGAGGPHIPSPADAAVTGWAQALVDLIRHSRPGGPRRATHTLHVCLLILTAGLSLPLYLYWCVVAPRRQAAPAAQLMLAERVVAAVEGAGGSAAPGLAAGELHLWSGPAQLVEPRKQPNRYVHTSSGGSVGFGPVRVGGSSGQTRVVPGREKQTVIDTGTVLVTTARVMFHGAHRTRTWRFGKVASVGWTRKKDFVLFFEDGNGTVGGLHVRRLGPELAVFLCIARMPGAVRRAAAYHALSMIRAQFPASAPSAPRRMNA